MAYNAVAQRDDDFASDFSGSPPLSPQEYQNMALQSSSPDLVPQTPMRSEPRSNEGSGPLPLRHPTPDLQSLQGAYVKNVERLEQSAERLSMSSDIGEELRKLKIEQRKSESRRSSILGQIGERYVLPSGGRQASHSYGSHASGSIVSTNNVARLGGFSPTAYFPSPRGSIRSATMSHSSNKGRSGSQGSRLAQISTSKENKALESMRSDDSVPAISPADISPNILRIMNEDNLCDVEIPPPLNITPHKQQEALNGSPNRPATAASVEMHQQGNDLFGDFDGVHIPHGVESPLTMDESINEESAIISQEIPIRPKSFMEPPPGENLVYYPAPVPMMLNMPQRLSKISSTSQRDKRRSEFLGGLPANARQSAAWLSNVLEGGDDDDQMVEDDVTTPLRNQSRRQNLADLPPQLRASVFFDYPASRQDVEVKGESAVATLDSILDASASAPVSAFTDHPIVGHIGAQVYGKSPFEGRASSKPVEQTDIRKSSKLVKKRNSASDLLQDPKKRNSSSPSLKTQLGRRKSGGRFVSDPIHIDEAGVATLQPEETQLRNWESEHSHHMDEDLAGRDGEFHDSQEGSIGRGEMGDNAGFEQYDRQPTTLLAELQLRKQQQKQRNRTAATAFPDGMRSTLLELDAVAHVQRQSRKQKHVTLAWEDPGVEHPGVENHDDEDVPLGMLFPQVKPGLHDRAGRLDEDRPLGLIAKREMEDNEPLSHRRARLRGETSIQHNPITDQRASMYTLNIPGLTESKEQQESVEVEGETLAQRRQRLRQSTAPARPISGNFADELMSQFGGLTPTNLEPAPNVVVNKTLDPEEETLGERRKRIQAEREATARNLSRTSVDAFTMKPQLLKRRSMADLLQAHPVAKPRVVSGGHQTQWTQDQQRASTNYMAMASRIGILDPGNRAGAGSTNGGYGMPCMPQQPTMGPGFCTNPMVYNTQMPYVSGMQLGQAPVELDRRQRDMIDRWRQSVMH